MIRRQQTIERPTELRGFGLFHGFDAAVQFLPAPEYHGIVFLRTDLPTPVRIPAVVEYVVPQLRRTVLSRLGVAVETVEHLLAALAGLQIDNCLIRQSGPEPPIGDGSAREIVDALLSAGIVSQSAAALPHPRIDGFRVHEDNGATLSVEPTSRGELELTYHLDYGRGPLAPQSVSVNCNPTTFVKEIASARSFVLEAEIASLRSQGFGQRATTKNVVVVGQDGQPVDGAWRMPDECARHKILDCLGDFVLAGAIPAGRYVASRSGHRLNHVLVRGLRGLDRSNSFRQVAENAETWPVKRIA